MKFVSRWQLISVWRWYIQNLHFLKYDLNQEDMWGYLKNTHNNEHNQLPRVSEVFFSVSSRREPHFDEIHSSPANTSHRQRSDSHWISDREEHHFQLRTFRFIDKVKDSVDVSTDGVVTNTSTCHERTNNIHSLKITACSENTFQIINRGTAPCVMDA